MEIGNEFLNFSLNQKLESITGKITLKLVSLPSLRFCREMTTTKKAFTNRQN